MFLTETYPTAQKQRKLFFHLMKQLIWKWMVERALEAGVSATYVLMDTWFTQQPLLQSIVDIGLDVIGMVKDINQRYLVDHPRLSLKKLYKVATPAQG